ncbi:MAG: hypothetical protein M3530_01650 [Thermoproteota archaeon]|nr:hypothetical protein [Thermoproteota archaeon]
MTRNNVVVGMRAITAAILVASVGVVTLQQQAYAQRECPGCITDFLLLTRSFGADAGKIILSTHSVPISQFVQLNLQFTKDIIKAVYAGHAFHPGDSVIQDLVNKYGNDVLNLHPPDSVIPLLRTYQQDVLDVFEPVT